MMMSSVASKEALALRVFFFRIIYRWTRVELELNLIVVVVAVEHLYIYVYFRRHIT